VQELGRLLLDGLDHPWVAVPHVEAADATREVDEGVPVDVGERRALAVIGDDREEDRERVGDDLFFPLENLPRSRPRNRRPELNRLRRRHGLTIAQWAAGLHR
jgi:hypothetical protein